MTFGVLRFSTLFILIPATRLWQFNSELPYDQSVEMDCYCWGCRACCCLTSAPMGKKLPQLTAPR
jgi:hypothetical protein